MIISENPYPSIEDFRNLMVETDNLLNEKAKDTEDYFIGRNGKLLESDVSRLIIILNLNYPNLTTEASLLCISLP